MAFALALAACGGERVVGAPDQDGGSVADGAANPGLEDGGADDGGAPSDGGAPLDGGAAIDGGAPGDAGLRDGGAACRPNDDGVIARAELAFVVGASATYTTTRPGSVASGIRTAGRDGGAGRRIWDFSASNSADQRVIDELGPVTGQWWSSSYTDASFTLVAERASGLLGVYKVTDGALQLLGTVSTEANKTNVKLDPPVELLRFPLELGKTWSVSANGSGVYNYALLSNTNAYRFEVDARGEVWTPAARFPALRLKIDLDQRIPFTLFQRTVRSFVFISECWGTVARVTGQDNDTSAELTSASEYLRVSP